MNASTKAWKTYEEVAQCLLERFGEQFGIGRVEGKQLAPGATGTNWEIDAKAFQSGGSGFLIVECQRYTTSH